jgi:hypothetical protein
MTNTVYIPPDVEAAALDMIARVPADILGDNAPRSRRCKRFARCW